jgi:hypothetical protein
MSSRYFNYSTLISTNHQVLRVRSLSISVCESLLIASAINPTQRDGRLDTRPLGNASRWEKEARGRGELHYLVNTSAVLCKYKGFWKVVENEVEYPTLPDEYLPDLSPEATEEEKRVAAVRQAENEEDRARTLREIDDLRRLQNEASMYIVCGVTDHVVVHLINLDDPHQMWKYFKAVYGDPYGDESTRIETLRAESFKRRQLISLQHNHFFHRC